MNPDAVAFFRIATEHQPFYRVKSNNQFPRDIHLQKSGAGIVGSASALDAEVGHVAVGAFVLKRFGGDGARGIFSSVCAALA